MTAPPLAVPTNQIEWEEYLNTVLSTPEEFAKQLNSGDFRAKMTGYMASKDKAMTDLKAELTEQITASVIDMAKRNGVRPDAERIALAASKGGTYNPGAPGALNKVWASGGQMLSDILAPSKRLTAEQSARLTAYQEFTAAYSERIPSEGGYLVPEETRADILSLTLEQSIVRSQAMVVPMSTSKLRWPVLDFTTEVGEVFGGIVMSWLDEGEEFTATSGTFAALALVAHKLGGLARIPNELVRDATALEAWVRQAMPRAVMHFEDLGFIKGNGVAKPLGGLHGDNPALIVVGDETGQSTASITWNNVLAMFARLLPESYPTAEWDITPDAIPEIMSMALPVGTGGSAVMLGEGQGPQKLPMSLLGIPIRYTRKAPAVMGTQGDISLVDWTKYVIGDTMTMTLDTSEHSAFTSDKTDFRIIERLDGQPGLLAPLTPENNGPTLSAFIQLETRTLD
jgi:HK97 family phage major capsid protein